MKKQLSLVVLMLLPMLAWADAVEIDGIFYYLYTSGNVAEVTEKSSGKYSGSVVIPEKVTYEGTEYSVRSIRRFAFYDCSGLTSVSIPNSVTSIGERAFDGCIHLTSIIIPVSVTSIEAGTFFSCI